MNRVVIALCLVVVCGSLIGIHSQKILSLCEDVAVRADTVEDSLFAEDWESVEEGLRALRSRWEQSRRWVGMTMDTNEEEDVEVSLRRCESYAAVRDKGNFIGEFTQLRVRVERLARREGWHPADLL